MGLPRRGAWIFLLKPPEGAFFLLLSFSATYPTIVVKRSCYWDTSKECEDVP
jgi:hypothetical protein